MAVHESIVLDPAEEAAGRTELDITPYIDRDGPDFGDAQIQAYMSAGQYGSVPVDHSVPNRTITIPLALHGRDSGDSFDEIRTKLQAKVGLWQREGGIVARQNTRVGTVYADVVNATLKLGGSGLQAYGLQDTDAQLVLECLPDWYGAEVSASPAHDETSLPELVWTETGIEGDYPGRVRLVVTERDGDDQLGLLWGFRSRHYSSASTAALAYQAEALTPISPAVLAADATASGSSNNVVHLADMGTNWTPVMNTNLAAGTYLTHTGSYRVWARVITDDTTDVQLRFVWDVGDLTLPVENAAWTILRDNDWYLADLGEVRLDAPPVGSHRWQGQIQAKGEVGGENVLIDRIWFQPLDEAAGRLRAVSDHGYSTVGRSARDEFDQSAGALTGKTAPIGGTWAGAGDADDFSVAASSAGTYEPLSHIAERNPAGADASFQLGRYAISGVSAMTAQAVQVDMASESYSASDALAMGVVARYTDTSNYMVAYLRPSDPNWTWIVEKRVAGSTTELARRVFSDVKNEVGVMQHVAATARLVVLADGTWQLWIGQKNWVTGSVAAPDYPGSLPVEMILAGQDSALATGGALASGKPGFRDAYTSTGNRRAYDNLEAWVPVQDAVAFANQSCEIRTDGIYREDSSGSAYGPVTHVVGDLPRLPPEGLEGRTLQAFVKASRGDLGDLPDLGIDDIRGQLYYRPCFLQLPDDTGS